MQKSECIILITGVSGYVGGRLVHGLKDQGYSLRCMARVPEHARGRVPEGVELVPGNVLDLSSLIEALQGIHTAYYLVHSMGDAKDFEKTDRLGAKNFAEACKQAGVKRIIYLGGLGDSSDELSAHLRSRHEVGDLLRVFGGQVIEFRASVVIGSGSLSFEMVRSLTEKLPMMITPKWVRVKTQPIGIDDLLKYLIQALSLPLEENHTVEIGGADVVSYGDLIREYAKQRKLFRLYVPVPFLTPRLSSLWLGLVTPLYARVGHKLITSLKNATVVHGHEAEELFSFKPIGMSESIRRALQKEDQEFGNTKWSDALSSLGRPKNWAGVQFGNRIVDSRVAQVDASPEAVFNTIQVIGGETGWYYANFLWKIRGFVDRLCGGPGLRRGRRDPIDIKVGDAIDFWRVEAFDRHRCLRLRAEMLVPGRAWLELSTKGEGNRTELRQTAIFDPVGLFGRIYWYALYPLHALIFAGMLRRMSQLAGQSNTGLVKGKRHA